MPFVLVISQIIIKENIMNLLITGASGFIGSFIVEEGLKKGYQVWAGIRRSSSKKYLKDPRIHFIELDFNNPEKLEAQLNDHKAANGNWDYIIHAAGATKCLNREDFFRTNYEGTRIFADTLRKLDMIPKQFVFVSSLSVYGAIRETPVQNPGNSPWIYAPIREDDTPSPNTAYGQSKLKAEEYIKSLPDFPYVILRPTGVYGPREKDYFLMAQSIKQHSDFAVGYRPQEITFVYVQDLVDAIFCAISSGVTQRAYFISDGQVYHSQDFSDLIQKELGIKWLLRIKAPIFLLKAICSISEAISKVTGKISTLNGDKFHILCQRNWQCDIEPARKEIGYQPRILLAEGVKRTIAWYKKEGWL